MSHFRVLRPPRAVLSVPRLRVHDPTPRTRWEHSGSSTSPPSTTTTGDTKRTTESADKVPDLPFLQRPLGLPTKPTTAKRTWADVKNDMLNPEKHYEERRHLVKQVTTGYYHDLNALKTHGGKTWIAPQVLIRQDKALYFPDISGIPLSKAEGGHVHTTDLCVGRVSIVAILTSRISEHQVSSFVAPALELYGSNKHFRYVQINLQENPLRSFLVSLFMGSLRQSVPEHLHGSYIVSKQNIEYIREPIGFANKYIGYVYLLDESLKIRWAGCGFARNEETDALTNCTRILLDRFGKDNGGVENSVENQSS